MCGKTILIQNEKDLERKEKLMNLKNDIEIIFNNF